MMCLVSFAEHWGPLSKPEQNPVAQRPLPCLWLLLTLTVKGETVSLLL